MSPASDPVPGVACSAGRLSAPARHVHRAVLAAFTTAGQPPAPPELDRLARACGAEPGRVRAELAAADLLAFTAQGEIRAAYPFSPVPTAIRVSWRDGPRAYAMCAIDALGVSAMLGRPVTITAAEPGSGRHITVAVDRDRARWAPSTAVVLAGAACDGCCTSADQCCGYINFFTTGRAARAWSSRHPEITGTVLGREQALGIGISQFRTLLQPAWRCG